MSIVLLLQIVGDGIWGGEGGGGVGVLGRFITGCWRGGGTGDGHYLVVSFFSLFLLSFVLSCRLSLF